MDVVILAGGKGTRLTELTHEMPKGLVPIGKQPILWHIMNIFARFGHRRFILCVGYQAQQIAEHFAQAKNVKPDWEVVTSNAGLSATKSERVAAALKHVHGERFMLGYGDDLADVNLEAVAKMARRTGSVVTLTAIQPSSPFGVLKLDESGRITGFREKSRMNEWINGGYMSVSIDVANYLHLGELEGEVFEALVAERKLNAYRHNGFWKAMNTHKQYLEFNEMAQNGDQPWKRCACSV